MGWPPAQSIHTVMGATIDLLAAPQARGIAASARATNAHSDAIDHCCCPAQELEVRGRKAIANGFCW